MRSGSRGRRLGRHIRTTFVVGVALMGAGACDLQDPVTVGPDDVFTVSVTPEGVEADGVQRLAIKVTAVGDTPRDAMAKISVEGLRLVGTDDASQEVRMAAGEATLQAVAGRRVGPGTVVVEVAGVRQTTPVQLAPAHATRVSLVVNRTSAAANGTDLVQVSARPLRDDGSGDVSHGLTVRLRALSTSGASLSVFERVAQTDSTSATVGFELTSSTPGTVRLVAEMGSTASMVLSDTVTIQFR